MPTFIKPGFWNKKRNKLAGELDLDLWLQRNLPTTSTTTTGVPPTTTSTTTAIPNLSQVLTSGDSAINKSIGLSNGGSFQDPGNWAYTNVTVNGVTLKSLGTATPTLLTNNATNINVPQSTVISPEHGNVSKLVNGNTPTPTSFGWPGEIRRSGNYIYICTNSNPNASTGTWGRFLLETSW
jgi:hypothetical protein